MLLPIPIILGLVAATGERPRVVPLQAASHAASGGGEASAVKGPEPGTGGAAWSPPETLPSGWTRKGRVILYNSQTLYDRIDGAAPTYLRAGYVQSHGAEYSKPGYADVVVADVYDMGSTARALGIFAAERDPSYQFISLAEEAYLASGSLNFRIGRFYVKLAGFEVGEAMDRGLMELGKDLAAALPAATATETTAVQAGLGLLPTEGRKVHGDGYSHGPLGEVKGLEGVFTSGYLVGKTEFKLFAVKTAGEAEAASRLKAVQAYFRDFSARIETEALPDGTLTTIRGDSAVQLVQVQGAVLRGALDLTDEEQARQARTLLGSKPEAAKP